MTQLSIFKYVKQANVRMKYAETLTRWLVYENMHQNYSEGIYSGYCNKEALDNFYANMIFDDEEELDKIEKPVIKRTKLVASILKELDDEQIDILSKTLALVQAIYIFTYTLDEQFGKSWKIKPGKRNDFAKALAKAVVELTTQTEKQKRTRQKTRWTELCSVYSPEEIAERNSMLNTKLVAAGVYGEFIQVKDKDRGFSKSDIYLKWIDQGEKCGSSGKHLPFAQAVGGHIIPHSKGGKTVYENLIVLSAEENERLGDEDLTDMAEQLAKELAEAA